MRRGTGLLIVGFVLLCGCTSEEVLVAHSVQLAKPAVVVPEAELLDIGIAVFDSGVPEGEVAKEVLEKLIREGTFVQIRRTEALYMAVLLRDTMQKSANWGTVWVTPKSSSAADVSVGAKILHSDGDIVQLHVTAVDATGRVWLDDDYEMNTAAGAFNRQRYPGLDPYQDVFNTIANDLAEVRASLSAEETREIRTVAGLRYAADLTPEAFTGYVVEERGRYELNRLPAEGDPMFDRTQRVRQRERLFLDTIDQHYAQFYKDATESYDGWREYSREEAIEIRELTKSARWRTGMGVATIVASIVYGSNNNDNFSDRIIRDAMMYIGTDMLRTSQVRRQEKRLHSDTLEELSASFDSEVKPLVVAIQGTEHRLTGTADVQYQEWRDLLKQMFVTESGFVPEDVAIYSEPEPEPALPTQDPLPTVASPAPVDAAQPVEESVPAGSETTLPVGSETEEPTEVASDAAASFAGS
jgi:hypothetical protein